ncbi:hypothetical protein GCM10027160_25480 [Streptomyces calidiresistens]|uniref:hypothetical protein n=1 Tax=Streptomyces calidiresistens TaxID=1485586 RepID=UPI0015FCC1BC|nr:hypothetical protein [Streptomyces calidiresistens]
MTDLFTKARETAKCDLGERENRFLLKVELSTHMTKARKMGKTNENAIAEKISTEKPSGLPLPSPNPIGAMKKRSPKAIATGGRNTVGSTAPSVAEYAAPGLSLPTHPAPGGGGSSALDTGSPALLKNSRKTDLS